MARSHEPADDLLASYLREQAEAVLTGLAALPDADAVHGTRVAIRRLRSTLRTFEPLIELPRPDRERVGEDLRWLGTLLGDVRDRQVQRSRFAAALAALPPEHVLGPVASRIDGTLLGEQAAGETAVGAALETDRCRALRERLEGWLVEPPVAGGDSGAVRDRARKAFKKAARRLRAVCPDGRDADLHRARKAAKRARYAAEVLGPVGRGRKQGKRFKKVQRVLGAHQDAVVAQETLRRLVSGVPAGESGFTFGLLHAQEQADAERLRRQACALGRAG